MSEVGGGVPIGGGDDEPAKIDVRTRRQGGRHRWASPRAPSMSLCRTVEDEEEAGEVDADVEVEACGRRAVGDSISSSARVKNREITKKQISSNSCSTSGWRSAILSISSFSFSLVTVNDRI